MSTKITLEEDHMTLSETKIDAASVSSRVEKLLGPAVVSRFHWAIKYRFHNTIEHSP